MMKQPKNLLLMNILNILKNHSDQNHRLSQQDIMDYLKIDYDMDCERKSIKRNIDNLLEEGYDIEYTETKRGKGKSTNTICTDFYLLRDFEDSELRLLIDGLLFSKYVPKKQCKDLIRKLESLSNEYFKSRVKYIEALRDDSNYNREVFYTIDIIDEAIYKKRKIKFNYCSYDINKKLVLRKNDEDIVKEYIVSPFQMVATNGRYYLICKFSKKIETSNFRIDRIKNVEILSDVAEVPDKTYNLPRHMIEHLYMMSGDSDYVTFEFTKSKLTDVIDWFGVDISIKDKGNVYEGRCKVNLNSMKYWAMQYCDSVKVLAPQILVDNIRKSVKDLNKKYN